MMNEFHIKYFGGNLKAIVRVSAAPRITFLFFHGAGLEPTADFYLSLFAALPDDVQCVSPFLSASHFLTFGNDFRKPRGWACHRPDDAVREADAWVSRLADGTGPLVVGGHSWGGYLAACVAPEQELVLLSPIPDLQSIVEANIDAEAWGETPDAGWLTCRSGAPFPFLSAATVNGLAAQDRRLSEMLAAPRRPVTMLYGAKEHPLISFWATDLPPHPLRRMISVPGAGHFYSGDGYKVVKALPPGVTSLI